MGGAGGLIPDDRPDLELLFGRPGIFTADRIPAACSMAVRGAPAATLCPA